MRWKDKRMRIIIIKKEEHLFQYIYSLSFLIFLSLSHPLKWWKVTMNTWMVRMMERKEDIWYWNEFHTLLMCQNKRRKIERRLTWNDFSSSFQLFPSFSFHSLSLSFNWISITTTFNLFHSPFFSISILWCQWHQFHGLLFILLHPLHSSCGWKENGNLEVKVISTDSEQQK